jgi:hypothetical protein
MANNKQSGTEAVQIELCAPHPTIPDYELRLVTWVEASLKPTEGMTLVRQGEDRKWTVAEAYPGIVNRVEGLGSHWKVVVQ